MTFTDLIPGLRDRGKHSPDVVIGNLREENTKLLDRQLAADDFFALLYQDVVSTNAAWQQEKARRQQADKAIAQLEDAIRLRDQQIDELNDRGRVGYLAEAAATKTQPIPVLPLGQAPFAATNPAHIAAWTAKEAS